MTFGECLNELVKGKKGVRAEWDEEVGEYIAMVDNKLMLWKPEDEKFHPLIVSTGDITGTDWLVMERGS